MNPSPNLLSQSLAEKIRRAEIEQVRQYFQPGMKVLELGGKTGFQAAILASWGCTVDSWDIAAPSTDAAPQYFPVKHYDGRHLPVPDAAYDAIYSSHMLYWEMHVPEFFVEMRRVLKPGGLALHILPTPAWRVLTCLTHYPAMNILAWKKLLGISRRKKPSPSEDQSNINATSTSPPALLRHISRRRRWLDILRPGPLGPAPSAWAEFRLWQRQALIRLFQERGFRVNAVLPLGIVYSGCRLFGEWLPLAWRKKLNRCYGSSSVAFVTYKTAAENSSLIPSQNKSNQFCVKECNS